MRIVLIADSFPPLKNSAAVLVFSLAEALASLGHQLLVITPSADIDKNYAEEDYGGFTLLRIRCGQIKSHHWFFRGMNELSLFFGLPQKFKKTSLATSQWDLIIWYSPSIFLGGLVSYLKKRSKYSYLILRDIMPNWMVDVGLMRKGLSYFFLKKMARYQYQLADAIGVQSSGNKTYIEELKLPKLEKLEVLPNWMPSISTQYHISSRDFSFTNLQQTILAGKKVLIYAGNLGEAQGIENFAQLLLQHKNQVEIGFLIIGRGSKKEWIKSYIKTYQIENVLMLDEVDLVTLSDFYQQSSAGLVFLDPKHQSHNIPGKFISYLEASLPVVACVNPGNDLINIIKGQDLGIVSVTPFELLGNIDSFIKAIEGDVTYGLRARAYYENHYRPSAVAAQIIKTYQMASI
jgi:glycosyltransferase involved in cell wall biosynthesis